MAHEPTEDNARLILRDALGKKKSGGKSRPKPLDGTKDSTDDVEERFDIIPISPVIDDYNKRAKKALTEAEPQAKSSKLKKSKSAITGDNYQHSYIESQRAAELEQQQQIQEKLAEAKKSSAATNNSAVDQQAAAKAYAQKQQEDNQRYRARELQNQVSFWEQQRGSGQYDDNTINGNVDTLRRELSGIPPHLQN